MEYRIDSYPIHYWTQLWSVSQHIVFHKMSTYNITLNKIWSKINKAGTWLTNINLVLFSKNKNKNKNINRVFHFVKQEHLFLFKKKLIPNVGNVFFFQSILVIFFVLACSHALYILLIWFWGFIYTRVLGQQNQWRQQSGLMRNTACI